MASGLDGFDREVRRRIGALADERELEKIRQNRRVATRMSAE